MKRAEPKVSKSVTRCGLWSVVVMSLALLVGCGEDGATVPRNTGATGGAGATGGNGTGGMVGAGGTAGVGATAGTGGVVGTGGSAGGAGSTGGNGGTPGPCATNALCHTCPSEVLVDALLCPDGSCDFPGYSCVPSGCETRGGAPIGQCQPSRGGSCVDDGDCPNAFEYDCMTVGAGGDRCVRVATGCDGVTESYDCPLGFSCEGGMCVDRRVPCDSYVDCPKSHVCKVTPTSNFCVRTFQTCHQDEDCAGLGDFCADVDGDGTKECAGELGITDNPCVNASCPTSSAPVCEVGAVGTDVACGDYGLCRSNNDCDGAGGFECVGLWQDERKECVRTGGTCAQVTQCPLQQVCASPRSGGVPSCQAGSVP